MTLTNDAELVWRWMTNFWLETAAGLHGSVAPATGWRGSGSNVEVVATADPYYHFTNWTGSVESYDNPLFILVAGPCSVTAYFAANMTTNMPTPEWWLAEHGFTNLFEEAVTNDADGDGVPTGEEYPADTNPTNGDSFLRIQWIDAGQVQWAGGTGVVQYLESCRGLLSNDWTPVATNLPPTAVTNSQGFPDEDPSGTYRIRAER